MSLSIVRASVSFVTATTTLACLIGLPAPAHAVDQYSITATTYEWIELWQYDADVALAADEDAVPFDLPWTFQYGDPGNERSIESIAVSSNGVVTLQEAGETEFSDSEGSSDCADSPPDWEMTSMDTLDMIFALHDDLDSSYYGFFGVKAYAAGELDSLGVAVPREMVVIFFETEVYADGDEGLLNRFEILLEPDGRITWNFESFEWSSAEGDPWSGLVAGSGEHADPRWNGVGCASDLGFDPAAVAAAGGYQVVEEAYLATTDGGGDDDTGDDDFGDDDAADDDTADDDTADDDTADDDDDGARDCTCRNDPGAALLASPMILLLLASLVSFRRRAR
jgi:hypothetical protein